MECRASSASRKLAREALLDCCDSSQLLITCQEKKVIPLQPGKGAAKAASDRCFTAFPRAIHELRSNSRLPCHLKSCE